MKTFLFSCFLLCSYYSFAQADPVDSLKASTNLNDSLLTDTTDKRPRNAYGDLLNDDPLYNKKRSIGLVLAKVTSSNIFGWAYTHYVMKEEWSNVSIKTWKNNFKYGWEWDNDKFGTNFLSHPRAGSDYFNVARSN